MFFLISFLTHVSEQNCQSEHFDCANKFSFRKSDTGFAGSSDYLGIIGSLFNQLSIVKHETFGAVLRTALSNE